MKRRSFFFLLSFKEILVRVCIGGLVCNTSRRRGGIVQSSLSRLTTLFNLCICNTDSLSTPHPVMFMCYRGSGNQSVPFMSYMGSDGVLRHESLLWDPGSQDYPLPPPEPSTPSRPPHRSPLSPTSAPLKGKNTAAMAEPHGSLVTGLAK